MIRQHRLLFPLTIIALTTALAAIGPAHAPAQPGEDIDDPFGDRAEPEQPEGAEQPDQAEKPAKEPVQEQDPAVLARLVDRPLPQGARALHHVLHIAVAQILYLDVPDHAAVDLAVEQANGDPRNRRFAALINAVLRRLIREKDA